MDCFCVYNNTSMYVCKYVVMQVYRNANIPACMYATFKNPCF